MASTRIKFTTQRLEKLALPPGKSHAYFYDQEIRGLCLYFSDSGVKTFYLYRRVAGRPTRLRLGSWPHELSIDDARKEARKASGDVAKGIDPHKAKLAARAEMTFGELMKSAKQALAYERGENSGHRVTRIARLRQQLKYSQSVFARVLNVSPKTVQAWEQGIRVPSDAALKLLSIAKRHPEVLLEA